MGFTVAILGRGRHARARQVFMELKIEKLFGEEFAGKPAPGRGDVPVLFPVRSATVRSFLRLSRAYYVGENPRYHFPRLGAISSSFRPDDITFSQGNTFCFYIKMMIIRAIIVERMNGTYFSKNIKRSL